MIGKIIKSQKEIYYVLSESDTFMCKARGVFRKKNIKPLVGDNV
ncbi:MAG: ribosome small subunit-dependent GTPase A, partial [Anaerococcus sp.]|nr:ribosome small subunit-dependent GTPase A [Anaerococcus sp.]